MREPCEWIAARTERFDSSGIRKVFDLAAKLPDPINLSIGQPDFDVPDAIKEACIAAIRQGKNGYSVTQGIAPLREELQARIDRQYGHPDRKVFICSGTSGGLVLAVLTLVDPGDEVILFDPYFVMYEPLVQLAGGVPVFVDTYPEFQIDVDRVAERINPRTKMIILNSPANPTGVTLPPERMRDLAELAAERGVALVSDEIYHEFCYDVPFVSPAQYNSQTIVIDGFSKSYAMTGWRLGYVHGPQPVIESMLKLQQYTFVCAPHPVQWAGIVAQKTDIQQYIQAYRHKRDLVWEGLADCYEMVRPTGAFYAFPKVPWGTATEFVRQAIEQNVLVIPGSVFSRRDTHFRISYAAPDSVIERGIELLRRLARRA